MVTPSIGSVVLVRFPFSDLSASKLRPAVVLATVDRGDWILCQVTSNPYSDLQAIEITGADFSVGTLERTSYARPGKKYLRQTHQLWIGRLGNSRPQSMWQLSQELLRSCDQAGFSSTMVSPIDVCA
jgi:mRNA interferase MazF